MMMRRILAVVLVFAGVQAFGQVPPQERQDRNQLRCVMFSVNPAQMRLTVIAGRVEGSGAGGNQPSDPKEQGEPTRYTVKVTSETNIHWQGGGANERLGMNDLARMSKEEITVPMTVIFQSTGDPPNKSQPLTATEIIVRRQPPK